MTWGLQLSTNLCSLSSPLRNRDVGHWTSFALFFTIPKQVKSVLESSYKLILYSPLTCFKFPGIPEKKMRWMPFLPVCLSLCSLEANLLPISMWFIQSYCYLPSIAVHLLDSCAYVNMCAKLKTQPATAWSCLAPQLLQPPPGLVPASIKAVISHGTEIESGLGM